MELRDYQEVLAKKAADLIWEYGLCYFAMVCRIGKTAIALRTAELYGAGSVLFLTTDKAGASVLHDYETLGMKDKFEMKVKSYESVHECRGNFDLAILDEAHCLGEYIGVNPMPNETAKTVKEICYGQPVIFMSDTPTPRSRSQLYHQLWCSSMSPFREYETFLKWAYAGYVKVRMQWENKRLYVDYDDANDELIDEETSRSFLNIVSE